MKNKARNNKQQNEVPEGLRSLLLRYKRVNLGILVAMTIVVVIVVIALLVTGPLDKLLKPSEDCLDCHKPEKGKYVHLPYQKVECLSCHTPHKKGEKSELKAPLQKLCLTCHGSIGGEIRLPFAHAPVEKGRCLECHKPHVSKYKSLLVKEQEDLCVECHRIAEELEMSDKHEPFERKQCLSCHVAHGSLYGKGLRCGQRELCIICHIDIAKAEVKNVQHLPFEEGRCTDCHGAHATDYKPQIIEPRPELCYLCHPEIQPLFRKASHHPATSEEPFNCSDCHNPHADDYNNLLAAQGVDFCFICHNDKEAYYVASAHNDIVRLGGVGLCQNCHEVHGADYSPLLIKDAVEVCKDCHANWAHQTISHPVGDGYKDELKKSRLTCSSTCHDPHGTKNRNMLKQVPDGLCLRCHSASELP